LMFNLVTITQKYIKEIKMGIERLTVKTSGGDKLTYDNLEAGEYEARLIYVASLGMQKRTPYKDGKELSNCQQIALCFEVLGSTVELNGETQPRTLWTNSINIFSNMSSMGNELPMYRAFVPTAPEDSLPDWEAQLGKPVSLTVGQKESKGRLFDKITNVSAIPLKYQDKVPEAVTTEFSAGGSEELDSPAIKNLRGYQKTAHENRIRQNTTPTKQPQPVVEEEVFDDAVPF